MSSHRFAHPDRVSQLEPPPVHFHHAQAYLAGLTFALAASPCSTPVLATLLAYVATADNSLLGGGLLLAYTTGEAYGSAVQM